MTLLTGPLLSEQARGTLAGLLTFSRRRGRNVAGRRNHPKQPRTEAQRATRLFMTWLTKAWAEISAADQASWLNFDETPLLSPYHAYLKHNIDRFKNLPGLWTNPAVFPNWPGQSFPVGRAGLYADANGWTLTGESGAATFRFNITDKRDNWGYAFFRVAWPAEPAIYRRLVHIATVQTNGLHAIHIANLAPGPITLYCQRFTVDGLTTPFWAPYSTTIL